MMRPERCSQHGAKRLLDAQMRAGEVGAQYGFPVVQFHAHGKAIARDRGVVHQNVEPAELLETCLKPAFTCSASATSIVTRQRRAVSGFDFGDTASELLGVARGDGNLRASLRQRERGGAADAL